MTDSSAPISVFVASTPLQLISCAEARHAYGCRQEDTLLVIARPDNRETERQMAMLVNTLGWRGGEISYLTKRTFYVRLAALARRLSGCRIERLFIGNKASWIHEVFYRSFDNSQVIFVDDGLATVKYYHAIHREGMPSRISVSKRRLLRTLGIRTHRAIPQDIVFFTFFPLPSTDQIKIRHHDFPVFRQCFRTTVRDSRLEPLVGFLGQPFGGKDRLQRLALQIQHIVSSYPGRRIVYFMHRKESRDELQKALAEFPVDVRQAGRPIEVEVALSGHRYLAFFSFASTALFTLKTMFPDIRVVQIDDPALAVKLAYYDEMLELFRAAGIESVRLNEA
ncbi:hypothetical protein SAMN04488073_3290 [Marinobacter gudaonensis]|uniref:Glycosyltransferase family 52 n=1 Tax=Marinobacter gudaonensis TaxID=375760 RepID=A0A1I6I0T8_9GAMM|nr:hypothetical protein [Marinobacter gudaonensis]SFR60321.1 hypothetical protein SAMN04488073_3290 [Marinobacter gudaonensis]